MCGLNRGRDRHLNQVAAVGRCVAAGARGPLEMTDLPPIVRYLQGVNNRDLKKIEGPLLEHCDFGSVKCKETDPRRDRKLVVIVGVTTAR